jgi:hypothetical protein
MVNAYHNPAAVLYIVLIRPSSIHEQHNSVPGKTNSDPFDSTAVP